jgi:hypothetical protein
LAKFYWDRSRYTRAIWHFENAWEETRHLQDPAGRWVADYALAHWSRLLVIFGRTDLLQRLFQGNKGHRMVSAPLQQMWRRNREVFDLINRYPAGSSKCGLMTLASVGRRLIGRTFDPEVLVRLSIPDCSLRVLAKLSEPLGFPLVPVERTQGDSFVVPSVVHLRQNHFVAILGQRDDFYWVLDPAAFEHARWVAAADLNSEASGRFLVSPRQIPLNWRLLTPEEAGLTLGRSTFVTDCDDQQCTLGSTPCHICAPGASGAPGGPGGEPGGPGGGPGSPGGEPHKR